MLENQHGTKALVHRSGNSDVDVTVHIDTSALAYAFACYLFADGRLNDEQYKTMIRELDRQYKKRGFSTSKRNDQSPLVRSWAQ